MPLRSRPSRMMPLSSENGANAARPYRPRQMTPDQRSSAATVASINSKSQRPHQMWISPVRAADVGVIHHNAFGAGGGQKRENSARNARVSKAGVIVYPVVIFKMSVKVRNVSSDRRSCWGHSAFFAIAAPVSCQDLQRWLRQRPAIAREPAQQPDSRRSCQGNA